MFGKQDLKKIRPAPAMGVINVMNSPKPTPCHISTFTGFHTIFQGFHKSYMYFGQ